MIARRNILIFHLGALGDMIVTWPIALALARLHPQSRVFYVTHGQKGALAERVVRVESLDVETGGWHRLFTETPDLPSPASRALAASHTVMSFLSAPDDRWSNNIRAANPEASLINISTTVPFAGSPHAGEEVSGHQADFLADQLAAWPAVAAGTRQILHSIAERGIGSRAKVAGPIVIHPGGGAARKCWAADRYLALASRLRAAGKTVNVLLGDVERERWPAGQIDQFRAVAEVKTPATLVDLFNAINSASAFVGNDSGPGHLAGTLGVPTLSLFGETSNPERWKPLGPSVWVIHQPLETIEVERVLAELHTLESA